MSRDRNRATKLALLLVSAATMGFLAKISFENSPHTQWQRYQQQYRTILAQRAANVGALARARAFHVHQRQLYLPDLERVDRCVTCHVAMNDPAMASAEQPLTAHPGDILVQHPMERVGCTICHRGQGRATVCPDAHGGVPNWKEPILAGADSEQACAKCHVERTLAGAPRYSAAQDLFYEKACLSCHALRGRGGTDSQELTDAAIRRTAEWHFEHFKDPKSVVPDSEMTDFKFTDEQAELLTFLMMSFTGEQIPKSYLPCATLLEAAGVTSRPVLREINPQALKGYVGSKVCIACHKSLHHDSVSGWQSSLKAATYDRVKDEPDRDRCLECHTTGYNPKTGQFAEPGVTCEGCHGPGKESVRLVQIGRASEHTQQSRVELSKSNICATCHITHVPKELHVQVMRRRPRPGVAKAP